MVVQLCLLFGLLFAYLICFVGIVFAAGFGWWLVGLVLLVLCFALLIVFV